MQNNSNNSWTFVSENSDSNLEQYKHLEAPMRLEFKLSPIIPKCKTERHIHSAFVIKQVSEEKSYGEWTCFSQMGSSPV